MKLMMSSVLLRKAPALNDIITLKRTSNRNVTIKICQINENNRLGFRKYYGFNVRNSRQTFSFILWTDCNEINNIRIELE